MERDPHTESLVACLRESGQLADGETVVDWALVAHVKRETLTYPVHIVLGKDGGDLIDRAYAAARQCAQRVLARRRT